MYNIKLTIGDFTCEHTSYASFKFIYKVATSCAKYCFNNRVRFGMTVESSTGERLLRVFTYHSALRNKWIARVSSNPHGDYNKHGLTLRCIFE